MMLISMDIHQFRKAIGKSNGYQHLIAVQRQTGYRYSTQVNKNV
jgi:DNA-binding response OmpR family regulator